MAHKRALSPFQAFETLSVISADDGKRFKRLDVSREVIRGVRGRGGGGTALQVFGFQDGCWGVATRTHTTTRGPQIMAHRHRRTPKKQPGPTKPWVKNICLCGSQNLLFAKFNIDGFYSDARNAARQHISINFSRYLRRKTVLLWVPRAHERGPTKRPPNLLQIKIPFPHAFAPPPPPPTPPPFLLRSTTPCAVPALSVIGGGNVLIIRLLMLFYPKNLHGLLGHNGHPFVSQVCWQGTRLRSWNSALDLHVFLKVTTAKPERSQATAAPNSFYNKKEVRA